MNLMKKSAAMSKIGAVLFVSFESFLNCCGRQETEESWGQRG